MARFKETVQIGRSPTIQYDASGLVNRLNAFSAQQAQQYAQQSTQRAFEKGREAFQPGQEPEPKKIGFLGGQAAKAYNEGLSLESEKYNKALQASYLASIDRDNREEISRISAQNPDNLAMFNDQASAYFDSVVSSVDPSARMQVEGTLSDIISSHRIRVQSNEIKKNYEESNNIIDSEIKQATADGLGYARDGDDMSAARAAITAFTAIDSKVEAGFIDSAEAQQMKLGIERDLTEEKFKGDIFRTFDDMGEEEAYGALNDLAANRPKGFTPDQWDDFIASTNTDLNRKRHMKEQEFKQAAEAEILDKSIQRGALFVNSAIPADPAKNSQDRKDINNYYDEVSQSWQGSPNDIINKNLEFIQNGGIVPDQLISSNNAAMRSGSPEMALAHAELIKRLQIESPNSIRDFSDESRAIAMQMIDATNSGMDSETALDAARKNTYGVSKSRKEEINAISKDYEPIKKFEKLIKEEFDPFTFPVLGMLRGAPDLPPGMKTEYENNFKRFMTITNANPEMSEQLAMDSTKRVWGVTDVGGKRRFMKYAPESFYSVEGFSNDWIDDQFNEEMELAGHVGAMLGVDERTGKEDMPSYPVLVVNDNGVMDVLEDEDGNVLRYQPDFTATEEYKELTDAPGRTVETARKKREKKMTRRANAIRRKIMGAVRLDNPGLKRSDLNDHILTDEGRADVARTIQNQFVIGKLDAVERDEALAAFGVQDAAY